MPDRHAAESDSTDDEDADAATDDAKFEAWEGVRHPLVLPVARPGEDDSLDPEAKRFIEEHSVEHSTTDADTGAGDGGVMEPVAVERGIPLINDLKQRLGSWLNK